MSTALNGAVSGDGREPILPLVVFYGASGGGGGAGASPPVETVAVVVDTGFDGELQLGSGLVRRLGYLYLGTTSGTLADGGVGRFDYHLGRVSWHGREREVVVIASDGDPLIGMGLLSGSRLTIHAVPVGTVRVEELSWEAPE